MSLDVDMKGRRETSRTKWKWRAVRGDQWPEKRGNKTL